MREIVQTIKVTDPIEARRARMAQFQSRVSTMELAGLAVNGFVYSVMKLADRTPDTWEVRIEIKSKIQGPANRRYNPRLQRFVDP